MTPTRTGTERARQRGYGGGVDQQSDPEHEPGCRKHGKRNADRYCAGQQRDRRRLDAAQVQVLKGVHIRHHAREQVSTPVPLEVHRGERLDLFVDPGSNASEHAQGKVMRGNPLQIPSERPAEAEELNRDDRDHQREHRGTLGCARDQVTGGRHQTDAEDDGQRAEYRSNGHAPTRRVGKREQTSEHLGHAACGITAGITAPLISSTIRSARPMSSVRCVISSIVRPA